MGVLVPLAWAHAIYSLGREANPAARAEVESAEPLFFCLEVAIVVLTVSAGFFGAGSRSSLGLFGFPAAVAYFVCLWLSAAALLGFEDSRPKAVAHRTVGTFLLMVYWLIGAWFLHGRIQRLADAALYERQRAATSV